MKDVGSEGAEVAVLFRQYTQLFDRNQKEVIGKLSQQKKRHFQFRYRTYDSDRFHKYFISRVTMFAHPLGLVEEKMRTRNKILKVRM